MASLASSNRKPADHLAHHFARGRISEAQYLAGREYQRHFAEAGNQASAGRWLLKCHRDLGQDGEALVRDVLIDDKSAKEIAAARGLVGADWERYVSRRLGECLNSLATVFGFSNR